MKKVDTIFGLLLEIFLSTSLALQTSLSSSHIREGHYQQISSQIIFFISTFN